MKIMQGLIGFAVGAFLGYLAFTLLLGESSSLNWFALRLRLGFAPEILLFGLIFGLGIIGAVMLMSFMELLTERQIARHRGNENRESVSTDS